MVPTSSAINECIRILHGVFSTLAKTQEYSSADAKLRAEKIWRRKIEREDCQGREIVATGFTARIEHGDQFCAVLESKVQNLRGSGRLWTLARRHAGRRLRFEHLRGFRRRSHRLDPDEFRQGLAFEQKLYLAGV